MKNLLFPILMAAILSAMFSSCINLSLLGKKQTVEDTNILFMNWAQASSGRWLPYTIRSSQGKSNSETKSKILDLWALDLKPVNVAKAYYRKSLGKATGLNDVQLDRYLDSLYLRRYKQVNASLRYRKTMDSLFVVYKNLTDISKSKASLCYTKGEATRNYLAGTGSKISTFIGRKKLSGNNAGVTIESQNTNGYDGGNNCIPFELTDWFDQHYNYLHANIVNSNLAYPFPGHPAYYYELIREYVKSPCANALFVDFFSEAVGFSLATESGVQIFTRVNCNEATDNILHNLTAYYSCLKQIIPDNRFDNLADEDPFEKSMSEVYISDYQFTSQDLAALAQLHKEDQVANSNYYPDLVKLSGYSQISKVKLFEIPDKKIVRLLGSIDSVIIKSSDLLTVSVFKVGNESGSAHTPATEEVTHQILIVVSEHDEQPEQHLFKLGDFYDPKIVSLNKLSDGSFRLVLSYGAYDKKIQLQYQINLRKIVIKN